MEVASSSNGPPSTFESIFFRNGNPVSVRVPDYQRAYTWEQKQIELFVEDLVKYERANGDYYFGHFIAEDLGTDWEIVDGQQRITTFVLFLIVCRGLSVAAPDESAFALISRFSTVSYDLAALETIKLNLQTYLEANAGFSAKNPPTDQQIIAGFSLQTTFTRSQRKLVLALLYFRQCFRDGRLREEKISRYVAAVMEAHCSLHLARDKSVAVNIFEMHNTRGVPLTTLEKIKALLMKFVYDHGGNDRREKVAYIQTEFGEIYGMEESVSTRSFRGEMSMDQLIRLHLRVVNDGTKTTAEAFALPAMNADSDTLVWFVNSGLNSTAKVGRAQDTNQDGVQYALNLATELKRSVRIVSETLPVWDNEDPLVGDALIQDRELSCQFFLIVCRLKESSLGMADGRIGHDELLRWERLLFTRDFHEEYYNLKGVRDDFPALFAACVAQEETIVQVVQRYLTVGFRSDRTGTGLQAIARKYLESNRENVLKNAFHWWRHKMIYALYKYEVSRGGKIREVMKGTVSVEHTLPQAWHWMREKDDYLTRLLESDWEAFRKEIDETINGIGNLLLITPSENTSAGNNHPADKRYLNYCDGGSYEEHDRNRETWRSPTKWTGLIRERGESIFEHMLGNLVGSPETPDSPPQQEYGAEEAAPITVS